MTTKGPDWINKRIETLKEAYKENKVEYHNENGMIRMQLRMD
jgi:hypothetical protein